MRWVVITDDYPPALGGVATWTRWAADALASRGEVTVFCRHRDRLVGGNVRIRPVRTRSFARRGPLALAWAARHEAARADGVLCTTWPVARWLSRFAPVQVVAHGSEITRQRLSGAAARTWSRARGRWAVSGHLAGLLQRAGIDARPLPLPLPTVHAAPGGDRWVCVTRALHAKGGDRFVRLVAAAGVPGDLVGDGPALGAWRALARRLDAPVRFHGALSREATAAVLDGAGAAFLLSRAEGSEGLGLTLIEARLRGIPVVGTAVGGLPEAVADGRLVEWTSAPQVAAEVRRWLAGRPRPELPDAAASRAAFVGALLDRR